MLSIRTHLLAGALLALPLPAQNLLTNPDFEGGLTGWTAFGNAQAQPGNPPQFVPLSGSGLCSMFGNFSGGFNVSGIFQQFPAAPGDQFTIDAWSRHWSGDPLIGPGAPGSNWVVMKIAFFDGGGTEIGAAESTILDGTFATDVWHDNAPVSGTAPAGTVNVQALILFLQPGLDGGAGHIEDVEFTKDTPPVTPPTANNLLNNPDFEDGLDGWSVFGNAFAEGTNPPEIQPRGGSQLCKMFGNFSGAFNVTGIFQSFQAVPGMSFTMDAWSRHWSGDPLIGVGAPNDNWVVMKIAFFDGGGTEIGAAEGTILDGNSPTDTWIDNAPIVGVAPPGTVQVQALILFLQPNNAGGAAQVEDIEFSTTANCELAGNGGFETGDFTDWDVFPSSPGNITIVSPGSGSTFAASINNTTLASASLIKNSFRGVGTVQNDEDITVTVDVKGSTAIGGVVFVELFSEGSGGVSKSEILGGGPLALDPDPTAWKTFSFDTTLGPDVANGVTLQVSAVTGGAAGSVANICVDNASLTVGRSGAAWTNYGAGWDGTSGSPDLDLDAPPFLGTTVNVQMGNASGATVAAGLFLGDQQAEMATTLGGTLLTNMVITVSFPSLAPTGGTFALNLPNLSILCGVEVYLQLVHVDGGASNGVAFSDGLRMILGQ